MSADKKSSKKGGEPKAEPKKAAPDYRIPATSAWSKAWVVSAALGLLGVVASFVGYDPDRFAFSWLFAFMAFLAIGLGSTFFVLTHHMAGAGWGVVTRRTAELFMAGLPVFALLFIPVATHLDKLYPWVHYAREVAAEQAHEGHASSGESVIGASVAQAQDHGRAAAAHSGHGAAASHGGHHSHLHAEHEEVIKAKTGYLNETSFLIRAGVYLLVWIVLSQFLFRNSTKQDETKDLALTRRAQSLAPVSVMAFGLSLTFAAFDWMMSLEPTWFSTIFGVQYFAVGMVSSLATLVVVMHGLRQAGAYGSAVTTEHFHDVGKLLLGFLVFWAYISFSQFMLIWYASIPEETSYYHLRGQAGWWTFSLVMVVIHFAIPFFLLMSRNVKRRVPVLAFGAGLLLVTHVIELFWLVMPYASPGELTVRWTDFAALFAVGGIYLSVVFFLMTRVKLIPVGDPRLSRSIHLQVG
jgi:hypothetical protein